MDVTVWHWVAFSIFVTIMLGLDLFVFHKHAHEPTLRESALWTLFWCGLALTFNLWIWWEAGSGPAIEFLTGYLVEWSLSVDNVFVFAVIFKYFKLPLKYQYRVLFWGILGAIVMRLIFILIGSAILHYADWTMPIFGAFLIYTGIMLIAHDDDEIHPDQNFVIRLGRRIFRVSKHSEQDHFFVKIDGLWHVTPLFLVLLVVESTDVMFAVDSVPTILGITRDTFIVFTSNIFAIMGLRALYFLLAGVMDIFHYLNYGLSAILGFVGIKMIADYFSKTTIWTQLFGYQLHEGDKLIRPEVSLLVVVSLLAFAILASILFPPKHDPTVELVAEATAPGEGSEEAMDHAVEELLEHVDQAEEQSQ